MTHLRGSFSNHEHAFFVIDTAYYLRLTSDKVDLKWAYYKLLTIDINRMDVGAAIPTTNRDELYSLRVDYPPKNKQTKIADVLSTYDDLIENNRRRMELLEEAARQLLPGMVRPPPLPRPRAHPHHQRRAGRMEAESIS